MAELTLFTDLSAAARKYLLACQMLMGHYVKGLTFSTAHSQELEAAAALYAELDGDELKLVVDYLYAIDLATHDVLAVKYAILEAKRQAMNNAEPMTRAFALYIDEDNLRVLQGWYPDLVDAEVIYGMQLHLHDGEIEVRVAGVG